MTVYMFPGQGSQRLGMGQDLFTEFPEFIAIADEVLGYSVKDLCLGTNEEQLHKTEYTQPALYVVNCLTYLKKINQVGKEPDFLVGHSLGEYSALFAADVFDFKTGLTLVQKRGQLMSQTKGGGMAAIMGITSEQVMTLLEEPQAKDLSIANFNAYQQSVISGPGQEVHELENFFIQAGAKLYIPLRVSGAFHSSAMNEAQQSFANFLKNFEFSDPKIAVLANYNALPYSKDKVMATLALQMNHPVQWLQSMEYLLQKGETVFEEVGPGRILGNLISQIKKGL